MNFRELTRGQFPLTVAFLDADTGETVWLRHVEEPGALTIPGFAPRKMITMVAFPDGTAIIDPSGNEWYLTAGAGDRRP